MSEKADKLNQSIDAALKDGTPFDSKPEDITQKDTTLLSDKAMDIIQSDEELEKEFMPAEMEEDAIYIDINGDEL